MTELFVRFHLFLARHRRSVLLLAGGFAACAVLLGRRLKLNEDFTDMLPMSEPAIAEQVEALKHIRQADRLYVDVQSTAPDPARLTEAADQMHAALRGIPGLGDFRYNVDAAGLREVYDHLQAQLPMLLDSNELHGLETRLYPAALERRLAWLKHAMSQPQGLMFPDVAQTDPAGIGDTVSVRLRALQGGMGDARIVSGRITSADGRHVLISSAPPFRSSEIQKSAALMEAVLRAARSVESRFPDGSVHIAITGAHRSALDNATMIREDSARSSVIATVAVLALMLAAYRRRWLACLGLLPTVFGVLGALVVFHLTGDTVSAVALGCGSILIGVTVDYGIYVLYGADDWRPPNREQLARAVAQLAPAITFGALTTMAAFFVMLASPVSGHRQLGLFGAVGVASAGVFAMVILPLLIPAGGGHAPPQTSGSAATTALSNRAGQSALPQSTGAISEHGRSPRNEAHSTMKLGPPHVGFYGSGKARHSLPLTSLMQRLFDWRAHHIRQVLSLLVLFTGICVAGVWRLRFDGDLARLNGVTAETRRDEEAVREVWGKALSLTSVVVSGANREEALQKNERVFARLRELQEKQTVESFSSIAPLMPSDQRRAANLRDWRAFWSETRLRGLSNALASAAANLGFRAGAFQPFLDRVATPQFSSAAATGADSAINRFAAEYLSGTEGRFFVTTLVKPKDRESFRQLRAAIRGEVPDAMLLNKTALADEITRIARRALPVFGGLVAVLNAALLYLLLGRLVLVWIALLPMAAGVFLTLGSLGLLGLPIDMSNFIFVIFVIGVGGDYSLFLVLAELEPLRGRPERVASTGGAVTICALTTLFGVGVLVLARHPALFSIGLTALLGIGFSLLATLFLVPLCMRWIGARCRGTGGGALARIQAEPPVLRSKATAEVGQLGPASFKERATERSSHSWKRKEIGRLYRYQGPYVTQFVYWKMKIDPLFAAVEAVTPPRGEILDLGCGYGIAAHWLTRFNPERSVLGADFDMDKIRVAQATSHANPQVTFERRELLEWPEYPACDCVLLCDVLHYFPRELKAEVLRKVFAALRPGGCLIVRDACAEATARHSRVAWAEKWAVRLGQNRTRHGLHFEDEQSHFALLREAGFIEIEIRRNSGIGSNLLMVAKKAGNPSLDVNRGIQTCDQSI